MKRVIPILASFLILISCPAQDIIQAQKIIDTLSSSTFWGRGYTNNGMEKSASYLASEFKTLGLDPISNKTFIQDFNYPVNTFPFKMELKINGISLKPGIDFLVGAESIGVKASGLLVQLDSIHFIDSKNEIEIILLEKLTWSVSTKVEDHTRIEIDKNKFSQIPSNYSINIESKFIGNFKAKNICGLVRGTIIPDSLLVITAHYDHLGGLGKDIYFPGANDNASGIALLLELAKFYKANPLPYSVAFMCFAGEEAGLLGSKYFTENPLFPLDKIKFLINIDLVGTGKEGISVVNGSIFKKEFSILTKINDEQNYFLKIKSRGKAANSDHYWFTEKAVPSFFIYTLGETKAYHDVYDRPETLPLTKFEGLFHLIVDFENQLMK